MVVSRIFRSAVVAVSLLVGACGAHGQSSDSTFQSGLRALEADNKAEAASLFQRACDDGSLKGCAERGRMARAGEAPLPQNQSLEELLRKACDGGEMAGCFELGIFTGFASRSPNRAAAAELFRQACDGDHLPACSELATQLFRGTGVREDRDAAIQLYQKACDGGHASACTGWGIVVVNGRGGRRGDDVEARRLFAKACDGGDPAGCSNVAGMYMGGRGGPQDRELGIELMRKSCASDFPFACQELRTWGVAVE